VLASFDGLGAGFEGPQGTSKFRNPSDNSLAVGPDHIVQTVNTRLAVYSKKGKKYDKSGTVLYGPVATKSVWAGFGGVCEARNNGDAVVRYDQLARRWLIVMPMFSDSAWRISREARSSPWRACSPWPACEIRGTIFTRSTCGASTQSGSAFASPAEIP